ncbi:helix-turn-helix domain-containing protein [Sphaerimonospora cavernae]|uniref:Helix-turn-helix domain-containing protein n=1 Tax=Sphaerimonospora cavernae TaxID=1740611 RepID=A0ABV6UAH7_9ACTN
MAHSSFGEELRRRRMAAGLSLSALATAVNYSKSHLSKVETGNKPPTPDLARLCDGALKAGGALRALAHAAEPPDGKATAESSGRTFDAEWLLRLPGGGPGEFASADLTGPVSMRFTAASGDIDALSSLLDLMIQTGRSSPPGMVLPIAIAQVHAARTAIPHSGGRSRKRLLTLAARAAEFTGWMAQESGDDSAGAWWTDLAVEFAADGADQELAEYADVRRALMTLYRGEAATTVHLAARVRHRHALSPRLRWLAALREAQGHALVGDDHSCRSAIDGAHALWERASRDAPAPPRPVGEGAVARPLGTSVPVDIMTTMVTGWCLHDLGRPGEAAEVLGRALPGLGPSSRRSRARFTVRRALALADDGSIADACALIADVLDDIRTVDSATIRADLRCFANAIRRRRTHPAVADLWPQLWLILGGRGPR